MVVIVLTDCPAKLRGDLTKWLFEINTGVYVGNLSARVREHLWKRICENIRHGQATMVYSAQGEQKMEFCVHNTSWRIVDFDGIKLMQRPLPKNHALKADMAASMQDGFSKASRNEKSRRMQIARQKSEQKQNAYMVIDIETTGLSHLSNEIIEVAALSVVDGAIDKTYQTLISCKQNIPKSIVNLTGITNDLLLREGKSLCVSLQELLTFIEDRPLVGHNIVFDLNFIQSACRKYSIPAPKNKCADTAILARRKLKGIHDYKLETVAQKMSIDTTGMHRALKDCHIIYEVYEKLNENRVEGN